MNDIPLLRPRCGKSTVEGFGGPRPGRRPGSPVALSGFDQLLRLKPGLPRSSGVWCGLRELGLRKTLGVQECSTSSPSIATRTGAYGARRPRILIHHGWPLSADDWDNQMMFFLAEAYRVIAHLPPGVTAPE